MHKFVIILAALTVCSICQAGTLKLESDYLKVEVAGVGGGPTSV